MDVVEFRVVVRHDRPERRVARLARKERHDIVCLDVAWLRAESRWRTAVRHVGVDVERHKDRRCRDRANRRGGEWGFAEVEVERRPDPGTSRG